MTGSPFRPLRVLAEKEPPLGEVGVRLPALRDTRLVDRVVRRVIDDEALEEGAEDVRVTHRGNDVWDRAPSARPRSRGGGSFPGWPARPAFPGGTRKAEAAGATPPGPTGSCRESTLPGPVAALKGHGSGSLGRNHGDSMRKSSRFRLCSWPDSDLPSRSIETTMKPGTTRPRTTSNFKPANRTSPPSRATARSPPDARLDQRHGQLGRGRRGAAADLQPPGHDASRDARGRSTPRAVGRNPVARGRLRDLRRRHAARRNRTRSRRDRHRRGRGDELHGGGHHLRHEDGRRVESERGLHGQAPRRGQARPHR